MMLSTEDAQRVYHWYCSVTRGDHEAVALLQSVGVISTHPSGIVLLLASDDYISPSTSYLKVVDKEKFFLAKIKHGF